MFELKRLWWCGALSLVLVSGVARAADEWATVEDEDAVIKVRSRKDINGKEVWAEKDVEANAVDVQTALMDAGDAPITYDGGTGSLDKLTISLTAAQAADALVMADIAALTAGSGPNGTVDEGGLNLTAQGWETIDWLVV